ncbi:uroporphyrinogen decarboxylase family protein [Neomoorella mulderi]|uniref:Uroporphyrinogen decarboxylase n=1 Tax=Moorella mulderi DSM 14980 TaxID=1122241 RepID=A0A151AW70_9FIRM|nr:uroporphyrinogen decarboxylase family protein [Moorella mulderi]KYH31914.1 uroporphyrinogen decarboxylase [Moorella mulderi DSM 14980]
MTSEEKQEKMFEKWLSPSGIEFVSAEAEEAYKSRANRIKKAIQLKETPDRVPVILGVGLYPARYTGMTIQDIMYDAEKAVFAYTKVVMDFVPDAYSGGPISGKFNEILVNKQYKWPGYGLPPNADFQYVEAEYMKADEYDHLIEDPSDFWLRVYLPRVFGALEPFTKLAPVTEVLETTAMNSFLPFGLPEVQEALNALIAAGNEAVQWSTKVREIGRTLRANGFPAFGGGTTRAPFDIIGDTLRGTRGIMLDMYRKPEKLLEAIERLTPLAIRWGVTSAKKTGSPLVGIPLHKGADGFLSDAQFKTFYWPSLRKVIIGLVEEGLVPRLFAEGGYNTRLEVVRDIPKGKTIWYFDNTDMAKAKDILGDVACIMGNVSLSLLQIGSPQEVEEYCKKLINVAGKGGGFILCSGASLDNAKPENVHAMIQAAKEYGVY